MGKNKLRKFSEMATIDRVFQYPYGELQRNGGCPLRGHWHRDCFGNDNPIVLELGCGKGEYTVGLAQQQPDRNFIGIDIKGARMWSGACKARDMGLENVAFLRTSIELLESFFAPGEVAEVWITFPDPQMKKATKRLTGSRFQSMYQRILAPGGIINLKTDSPFLYTYTQWMLQASGVTPTANLADVYAPDAPKDARLQEITTHYEAQWRDRGLTIKYLAWPLTATDSLVEPESEPEPDTYRSYSRGYIQMPQLLNSEE